MAIRTIFTTAADCERDEALGWQEFVASCAPLARRLLEHYFPSLQPELDAHVTHVFRQAHKDDNAWFAGLHFANEREFLMAFRELVFACARPAARIPTPEVSVEQARALLSDLPVVERELLWMLVKGYDARQTADILMNTDATATALDEKSRERVAQLAPGGRGSGATRALLELAENARTADCPPLKTFNNLINGQISWHERDRAERHMGECLYCVDRFTAFQEMIWLGRHNHPLSQPEVQRIIGELGLPRKKKGIVARLFPKSA